VKGGWRELRSEEVHDLCSSNIIRVIKSGSVKWTGHAARIEEGERHTGFWVENVNTIGRLEDLGVNGRIILKCAINK
jgi:hypothetical protein